MSWEKKTLQNGYCTSPMRKTMKFTGRMWKTELRQERLVYACFVLLPHLYVQAFFIAAFEFYANKNNGNLPTENYKYWQWVGNHTKTLGPTRFNEIRFIGVWMYYSLYLIWILWYSRISVWKNSRHFASLQTTWKTFLSPCRCLL